MSIIGIEVKDPAAQGDGTLYVYVEGPLGGMDHMERVPEGVTVAEINAAYQAAATQQWGRWRDGGVGLLRFVVCALDAAYRARRGL